MAYNRPPNVVLAGRALIQNPPPTALAPAGIIPVSLDAEIATTTRLGVVQIGSGINVDINGVISASGTSVSTFPVTLVNMNYDALQRDYYIGATANNITITLPLGLVGKVFVVKNQVVGNIRVQGSLGETLDNSAFKTLGGEASLMAIFDGTRWNLI